MADHSRVLRLAADATGASESAVLARLDSAGVHITIQSDLTGSELALCVMVSTLRRMPGMIRVDPTGIPDSLVRMVIRRAAEIDAVRGVQVAAAPPAGAVELHLGQIAPTPKAIRVVPDGYGARLARGGQPLLEQRRPANALGSIFAAALGAGEAFKDAAQVLGSRRIDHESLVWCPVTLSEDVSTAPMLTAPLAIDIALAGCGAIGTGNALILSELDAAGEIQLFDRQTFASENVATYSLGTAEDGATQPRKVDLVSATLRSRYRVQAYHLDVESLAGEVDAGRVQ